MNNNRNPDEIGAIWPKEVNGKKFYTGKVTINGVETKIVIRDNTFKKDGDNQPTHRIYIDTWVPTGGQRAQSTPSANKPVGRKPSPTPRSSGPTPSPEASGEAQPVGAEKTL